MPASGVRYQVSLTPVPQHANGHPTPRATHAVTSPPPTPNPPLLGTSTHASWGPPSGQLSYQDAVTSGTRSDTSLIQCAAAMQDTRQVTHSSSGKMSSEHPREAIEEVEDAAFAMREELKEAEAAVEACFQRRARRAGLAGMLPAGRPMTEKELDTLSELLGDGFGARAKRRREIEQMTLVEMEAELGEVRTEIKSRRRAGMGWLLLTLVLLLCFTGQVVEEFTAYDCFNRSNVMEAYSLLEPDACTNMGKEGEVETTVYGEIVQIKQDRMILVFRCIVIETLVSQYCGMFSAAGVARYIRFRELSALEAWECCRRGRAPRSSSTAGHLRARSGQWLRTAGAWLADLMTRVGVRSASSPSLMARRWMARRHKGCTRSRSERSSRD
jgi:hypothetical protein